MLWCFELSVSERSVKASASGECEALSVGEREREFVVAVCCGSLQVWTLEADVEAGEGAGEGAGRG